MQTHTINRSLLSYSMLCTKIRHMKLNTCEVLTVTCMVRCHLYDHYSNLLCEIFLTQKLAIYGSLPNNCSRDQKLAVPTPIGANVLLV